jgi:hypothetical protein
MLLQALVNTLQKFSDSIRITQAMRGRAAKRAHQRAIPEAERTLAIGVLAFLFVCLIPGAADLIF